MNSIQFQYPTWYLLLCLLLGLAYALFLYFRETKFNESAKWVKPTLAILRTLAVAAIAALLLSPFVKSIKEDQQDPIVIIAQDQSGSIASEMNAESLGQYKNDMAALRNSISAKYQVEDIVFGDDINTGTLDSFPAQVSNLSKLMRYINDTYADQNVGAVVLATDGIYNEGRNPIYEKTNLTAPFYNVALGDTTRKKDILIRNVYHNKIAYLGDKFSIQVDIQAINANGSNATLRVQKVAGKKVIDTQRIPITSQDFFTTKEVIIEANQTGNVKYRISVTGVNGEASSGNNYKDIYIEVLDARQKILILANAPHPDLGALRTLIENNKNYEVSIHYPDGDDYNILDFSTVILHNLPSRLHPITAELSQLKNRKTSTWYILGAQTDMPSVMDAQSIVSLSAGNNALEEIQATVVPSFAQFTITDDLSRKISQFPPLVAPFGNYKMGATAQSLLHQSINKVATDYPMLAFSNSEGSRQAVLVGEGIWKWRLFDYLKYDQALLTQELVNKTVQYLSVKDDKRKFRASASKNIYKENENIVFDAQLYNNNYELINDPEVSITVKDESGKEYPYVLNRSNGYYSIDAGRYAPGNYTFSAKTKLSDQSYTAKGGFSVQAIQLESYDLTARHGILHALSDKFGGNTYLPNQISQLGNDLMSNESLKPVIYQSQKTQPIMHNKWLFFLLAGLLILEWFIRRYMGSY